MTIIVYSLILSWGYRNCIVHSNLFQLITTHHNVVKHRSVLMNQICNGLASRLDRSKEKDMCICIDYIYHYAWSVVPLMFHSQKANPLKSLRGWFNTTDRAPQRVAFIDLTPIVYVHTFHGYYTFVTPANDNFRYSFYYLVFIYSFFY